MISDNPIRNYVWDCKKCQRRVDVDLDPKAMQRWSEGMEIGEAMPDIHENILEMLSAHWCLRCTNEYQERIRELAEG